ncbi:hypothetical protein EV183_004687 [Coemansia sp. RSA 2336]|nr:hypothetical protein EV183_004687 [Coemansia sp. RSA 2336]
MSLAIAGALMVVGSPYGSQTQYQGKLTVNGKLAWLLMELVSPVSLLCAYTKRHAVGDFLATLWLLHYLHRAVIYPLRQPSRKPMHVGIMLSAIAFNVLNGCLNGHWLAHYAPDSLGNSARAGVGLCLFVLGMAGNVYHDNILMGVRTRTAKSGYAIPRGGLFELVSCPHFLCEIVEWLGFAVLSGSPAAWTFCLNVVCNLVPRAYFIHKWYHATFADYPQTRTAIVPYLL